MASVKVATPVKIPYEKLVTNADLSKEIEEAFGFAGLGLIVITGIPNFVELRKRLLPLGTAFASLPDEKKEKVVHAPSNFSVGWSHGKEKLKRGEFDTYKGSFYGNPITDSATNDQALIDKYPQDYYPNLWPKDDLPDLEHAFKALGQLMINVGAEVARHCDTYVKSKCPSYEDNLLENVVRQGRIAKGRLLHYFPIPTPGERARDSWCGWHNDHSCLTALCSSYYMDSRDPTHEIDCPDPAAGLYARTRQGEEAKIPIPRDALAFQIGESSQILTGGYLRATPHAVQALQYPESEHTMRDTFAVFMQPNHDKAMEPPAGVPHDAVAVGQWKTGMSYGQFSKITVEHYYAD